MTDCTRRFTRVRVRCFVEMRAWHNSHPACRDGHITVLNERGGFVEIGGDHAVNTHVMLRFGFPISDVLCIGVVRHHEPAGGIGVEFLRLSDTDREHVGQLIQGGGKAIADHNAHMLRREYTQHPSMRRD